MPDEVAKGQWVRPILTADARGIGSRAGSCNGAPNTQGEKMDRTALVVLATYAVTFFAGFATRSLLSWWRRRNHEPKLPMI